MPWSITTLTNGDIHEQLHPTSSIVLGSLVCFPFNTFPVNCFYAKVFLSANLYIHDKVRFLVRDMLYQRATGDRLVGDNAILLSSCVIRHSTYCALGLSIGGICTMMHWQQFSMVYIAYDCHYRNDVQTLKTLQIHLSIK